MGGIADDASIYRLLSKETQSAIANSHILRYRRRIESGSPMVRRSECQHLLRLWLSVREAIEDFTALSFAMEQEFNDAIYSEECDGLMTEKEMLAVSERRPYVAALDLSELDE